MKELVLNFYESEDEYGDVDGQEVYGETEKGEDIYYNVYNMCECPEDATIDRDLFSGYDFINTLELGMKIANEGYTSISYRFTDDEDDEEV